MPPPASAISPPPASIEGRRPYGFSVLAYLARNPDLQAAFGPDVQAATLHYIRYGYREGRSAA